jgi:hypothetical protein
MSSLKTLKVGEDPLPPSEITFNNEEVKQIKSSDGTIL